MKKPNNIAIFILAFVVFVFILVMIMVLPSIINKEETYIDEGYTEQYYTPESIVYDNTLSEPIINAMSTLCWIQKMLLVKLRHIHNLRELVTARIHKGSTLLFVIF